ncbi:MAG: flagellar biosynthetic protein FliO [Nitrospinota bacterium]|nr:flagellar biosynthetic protein FliO [Nitrospinota bacterium]
MKNFGQIMAGTLGFILLWVHLAVGAQPLSSYNLLRDVSVERKQGELWIQLNFKNPPTNFQQPQFFKKSIQMDFPFAYVNPSKRYFETGDSRVQQVYISQFDRNRMRLRLILAPGTISLQDKTVVEQVGSVLRIRLNIGGADATPVNHPEQILASNSKMAPASPEAPDLLESLLVRANHIQAAKTLHTKTSSGQQIQASAPKEPEQVPPPADELTSSSASSVHELKKKSPSLSQTLGQAWKNDDTKDTSQSKPLVLKTKKAGFLDFEDDMNTGKIDLFSASLKMVYTLVLVLGLMFIVFHLFKKFGLKNSVFGGEGRPIKVLSTGFLAPRKSIALVEVAGDVLVLGIANDQISLLGNVQDPEKIEQIKGTLSKNRGNSKRGFVPSESKPLQKPEIAKQSSEAPKPPIKKEGVDVYNKRLIKPGSTNPFGEYVKQFTENSGTKPDSSIGAASRVRKKLEEVPVFE